MSFIKGVIKELFSTGGYAKAIVTAVAAFALCVGMYYKFASQVIDSPMEQVAEGVLYNYGVDIDFSEDKKLESGDE